MNVRDLAIEAVAVASLVLLDLGGTPAQAGLPPARPLQRQALLVGAGARGSVTAGRLHELADQLRTRFGYRDADVVALADGDATQQAVRVALDRLQKGGIPRSVLLAVFLPTIERDRDVYLVPEGGDRERPWTLIPVAAVGDVFSNIDAVEKLLILPGCPLVDPFQRPASSEPNRWVRGTASGSSLTFCPRIRGEERDPADMIGALVGVLNGAPPGGALSARDAAAALRESAKGYEVGYAEAAYARSEFSFVDEKDTLGRSLARLEAARDEKEHVSAIQWLRDSVLAVPRERRGPAVQRAGAALLRVATRPTESVSVRTEALWAAGAIGYEEGVPELGRLAESETSPPELRKAAIDALSRIGGDEARRLVRGRLSDPAVAVRLAAVGAAGNLKDAAALSPLLDLAERDPEADVRAAAVQTLPALPGLASRADEVRTRLAALVRDPAPAVRRETIGLLGTLRVGAVPREILDILRSDPDATVRAAAAYAVGRLSQPGPAAEADRSALVQALSDRSLPVRGAAAWALGRVGGDGSVKKLAQVLADSKDVSEPATTLRRTAAESLGMIGPAARAAAPQLERSLRNDQPEVRAAAALALGRLGDPRTVESLRAALKDPDLYVRNGAETALAQIPTVPADGSRFRTLVAALGDPSVPVRVDATRRLAETGNPKAVPELVRMLADDSPDVRSAASAGLTSFRDPASLEELGRALAHKSPLVRQGVVAALGVVAPDEMLPRIASLFHEQETGIVKAEVVRALASRSPAAYKSTIAQATVDKDPVVRLSAVSALGKLSDPESRGLLFGLARDPDPSVRQSTIEALQGFRYSKK